MKNFHYIYLWICLSIIAFTAGIVIFWVFWPYRVVDIKTPVAVITKEVKVGGTLIYEVDYCKYTDAPALVTRQLRDRQVIFLPEITTNLPKGCYKSQRTLDLPMGLAPDTYTLRIATTYKLNPLRSVNLVWETEPFRVYK